MKIIKMLLCAFYTCRISMFYGKVVFPFLLIMSLLSCSSRGRQFVIGVSQCSEDNWREKLNTEMRISTFLYDNVTLRISSADDNDKLQMEQINRFVDDGVDMLIVSPNQINSVSKAIDRAYDKGIPVILFDRKTDTGKYTAFIGADNYSIGRTMARFIVSRLGGKGNVVELCGLMSSSPAMERHQGFTDEIARHPGVNVIASVRTDWTREAAKIKMDSIILKCKDIDAVFGHNDRMASGARQAMEEAGLGRNTVYVGIDALSSAGGGLQRVKNGSLDASYIYPTRGDLVVQLAMNILEKRPYKKDNYIKSTIITADNAEAMLLQADETNTQQDRLIKLHAQVDRYLAQYKHQKIYLLLFVIIVVLLIGITVYIYRSIMMKRVMAEEAANAKLRFFTNVSHEFRTPLTLIADPVNRLLEDKNLEESQRRLLFLVQRNVKVMLKLIGEILDFRKIQNGKMPVDAVDFDAVKCFREWAAGFAPTALKKGVDISCDMPERMIVHTDRYKVERIFYNLLSNALKYVGNNGHIRITLSEEGGAMFRFAVEDDGIGLSNEAKTHVFERFFQAKGSVSGTGIGLSLVKAFSELLGGKVSVDSKLGRGSVFSVVLPKKIEGADSGSLTDADAQGGDGEEAAGAATHAEEAEDGGHGKTLLVVDDNADVREYIASLLEGKYKVIQASDGREGLEKATREVPDLIVCDVMMPDVDGFEMCKRLKSELATSHIPVILLTALSEDERRADGYESGADAYVTKPFSSKVLLSRIENLLDNYKRLRNYFTQGDDTAGQQRQPADVDSKFLNNLRSKIQEHLSDSGFNVEILGSEMGLSRVQLYRKVKALTGYSIVELIRITRLKKARTLLRGGEKTVSEVSYEVGFSSPSYFNKCYKDYFGQTPKGKV